MAKHSKRGLSKKGLMGLKRITNNDGKRVWLYKGEQLPTLRTVVTKYHLDLLGLKP